MEKYDFVVLVSKQLRIIIDTDTACVQPALITTEDNLYLPDLSLRPIRVYSKVNYRYISGDFFCKLALVYGD